MSFKVGDPVWQIVPPGHYRLPAGKLKAIVIASSAFEKCHWCVEIEGFPSTYGGWHTPESYLRHRRDPPDEAVKREELGSWDLCLWKPHKTTVA